MPNIEELLRKAMAEGKFDNLPGKGKPLNLEATNPYTDPEWELAYRMLKEAGYSLPWIEEVKDIERELEAARNDLHLAWSATNVGYAQQSTASMADVEWGRAQASFRDKLTQLNNRIRSVNLQVPNPRFQRPLLDIDQEVQKITTYSS
jgi:DnaJ family protein C protein 28